MVAITCGADEIVRHSRIYGRGQFVFSFPEGRHGDRSSSAAGPAPPKVLPHHLRQLKLPTSQREYEKLAAEAAREGLDRAVLSPSLLLKFTEKWSELAREVGEPVFARRGDTGVMTFFVFDPTTGVSRSAP